MALNINPGTLGYLNLEGFVTREEIDINHLSQTFIGGGQAGGKISAELVRCGYYANLYNTCKTDLEDIKKILEKINGADYDIIRLKGYDGASKDREIGLKAIQDNSNLLKEKLINNEKIANSDFTWIVVGLGGGTGNGSVGTISQIVSILMKGEKRYKRRTDANNNIIHEGYPTVGIIAAIPDKNSTYKIKLNSALALREIEILQEKGLIGAVLLIDNDKLINDFIEKNKKRPQNIDWVTYGNTTVAQLLTEISLLSSLPGTETLDKSEILDIWSTPSFLTIGKSKLPPNWLEEYKERSNIGNEDDQEVINRFIRECFDKQNVFADGFDFSTAIKGSLAVLAPSRNKVISTIQSVMMKRALSAVLQSPFLEQIHYGIIQNNITGSFKNPKSADKVKEAIVYTMCATKNLPKRISKMTEEALKSKEIRDKKLQENNLDTVTGLVGNKLLENEGSNKNKIINNWDLNSILEGKLYNHAENEKQEKQRKLSAEEQLDKILGL